MWSLAPRGRGACHSGRGQLVALLRKLGLTLPDGLYLTLQAQLGLLVLPHSVLRLLELPALPSAGGGGESENVRG